MKIDVLPVLGSTLLGALVFSCCPQATAKPVVSTAPASTNQAARKLIAQSIAAYAALKSYSSKLTDIQSMGTREHKSSGTFSFARPNRARLELTGPGQVMRVVQDGKQLTVQTKPDSYYSRSSAASDTIAGVLEQSQSISSMFLVSLMRGQSVFESGPQKQTQLSVSSAAGFSRVTGAVPLQPKLDGQLTIDFDPASKLVRAVQLEVTTQGQRYLSRTVFSEIQVNPQFAPDHFTFKAPPGVKKVTEEEYNAYWDLRLKSGAAPFPLSGKDIEGVERSLAQYQGKVVLVDFWATWCGPCRAELPFVLDAYGKYHAQGFEILGISSDRSKQTLVEFTAARKMPWPQILELDNVDSAGSLSQRFGLQGIPFTLLIGRDGKIAAVNPRGKALVPALKAALAKK